MAIETVAAAVRFVIDSGLAGPCLTIVWHAGEPMVVPVDWYAEAYAAAIEVAADACEIHQSFQTNGMFIDRRWIDFFKRANTNVGISLDGPEAVHNANRRKRDGTGTHAEVMRGIEYLRSSNFDFHVISVVTSKTLEDPQGFTSFFEKVGQSSLGLNFEEIEGVNYSSSLNICKHDNSLTKFLEHVVDWAADKPQFKVREIRRTLAILRDPEFESRSSNDENTPFSIVSVDTKGNLSTFSPELLGQYGNNSEGFIFGNVHSDTLSEVLANANFQHVARAIAKGVDSCRSACAYFRLCHGGAPSNKSAENGSLASTETQHCRVSIQALNEVILSRLEREL